MEKGNKNNKHEQTACRNYQYHITRLQDKDSEVCFIITEGHIHQEDTAVIDGSKLTKSF